jgi:hypothetical protein
VDLYIGTNVSLALKMKVVEHIRMKRWYPATSSLDIATHKATNTDIFIVERTSDAVENILLIPLWRSAMVRVFP